MRERGSVEDVSVFNSDWRVAPNCDGLVARRLRFAVALGLVACVREISSPVLSESSSPVSRSSASEDCEASESLCVSWSSLSCRDLALLCGDMVYERKANYVFAKYA